MASKNVIKIDNETEGDQIGTRNYRFSKIGESVPIKSDADFKFDMDSLPCRPLAVSERFGVIFVAHSSGFCAARTQDVMDTAEEFKNGGNGSCIQELSFVDVLLGKVSILALSAGSFMLAASVGSKLYFFTVEGLLNKDIEPSFSKSLDGSSCIKDMQWNTHSEDQYVVLTSDGNLYGGAGQDDLNKFMDNVDAVGWSRNGKFLAVAKHDCVSILSSKFEEKLQIMLSFDSLVEDSDPNCAVKVDSIRWVRPDCIILGCYSLSADGKEENYQVRLITVKDGKITNPSSSPVALAFSDAFLAINDDCIPFGSGPYMFVSYLDECEIAFVANRKNTDQHIVLFGWSSDEKNEATMIEISNDAWLPTINLQDNSDDNLILGLAVNKVYQDEKIKLVLGEEDTEVSPCCVLMCLTIDGKLFMFHFASATGPSTLPEDVNSGSDEDQARHELQPQKVELHEPSGRAGYEPHMRSRDEETKSTAFSQLLKGSTQQDVPVARLNDSGDEPQSLRSQQDGDSEVAHSGAMVKDLKRFENQEVSGVKSSIDSVSESADDKPDKTLSEASFEDSRVSTEASVNKASTGLHGSSDEQTKPSAFSQLLKHGTQQDVPVARLNDNRDDQQSLLSQKQDGDSKVAPVMVSEPVNFGAMAKDMKRHENQQVAGTKSSADSVSKSANDKSDKTLFGASFEASRVSTEVPVNKASTGLHGSSGSFSSGSVFASDVNDSGDEPQSLRSQQDGDSEVAHSGAMVKDLKRFENQEVSGVKSSIDSVSESADDKPDKTLSEASFEDSRVSTEASVNKASTGLHGSSDEQTKPSAFSQLLKHGTQQDVPVARLNDNRDDQQSLLSQKQDGDSKVAPVMVSEPVNFGAMAKDMKRHENQQVAGTKSSADSVSKSANDKSDKTLFGASFEASRVSTEVPVNKASTGLHGSSGSFSSGSVFASNDFGVQSFSSPHAGSQGSAGLSGKLGSTNLQSSSGLFSSKGIFSTRTSDVKSPVSSHAVFQGNRSDSSAGSTHFPFGSPQRISFPKTSSGPSISSNLLAQGASTGAGIINSSPVVSNVLPSLGKSSELKFSDKGNQRSHTTSRLLNSEPNLSEQRSVEEMAKELDALLDSVEGPGGFYDASVAAHKPSVTALEESICVLSDRCRKWMDTLDQGIGEVQLHLDKTVQVMARKIYMEAILKQATDSQYLDIWNRQKLSSELEMKRRHILEINQNLTNQLIELERHLNTLELQRFGDKNDVQMNRRSFHAKHGPPRHVQSLHSLHNTMNAQLAAAEKLSECLSMQMAVLSIDTEPVKKQNVKKELFDTIGISYDGSTFSSPGQEKSREIPSKSKAIVPSSSAAANTDQKKSQLGAVKSSEPETARRRRDSLDRSWASIEPPKTTVKRMLLQEDRQMSPGRLPLPSGTLKLNHCVSEGSVVSHDIARGALNMSQNRGSQDVQIKRYSEGQPNSLFRDSYRSDPQKTPTLSVLSLGSGSQATPFGSRDAARDSHDSTAENSRSRLTFNLKSDPVVVNDPKFSQQSQSFTEASSNFSRSLATNIFQKKPVEFSESKDSARSTFAVGSGNQKPVVGESSSIWSRKVPESPFSAVTSASSGTAFSGKSFSLEASTRDSRPEVVSSSIPSLPISVASASTSFVFKDATSSSASAISSTGFGLKWGATQTVPQSGSSASFSSFSSATSFGGLKEPMTSFSTKPSENIDLNTSKSEISKLNPDTSESSAPHVISVPKFDLKSDSNSSAQTSPPETVLSSGASSLKLGFSVSTSEPLTSSFSGSQLNSSVTGSPVLASTSKSEQPLASPALSSPTITNPVDGDGKENGNSDIALTQEDEMDEEASDTTQLNLGNLGGFGLGSAPNPAAPKQNPFGASFGNVAANTPITSFTAAPSTGSLFRPASFNIESQQPSQPTQQTNFGAFSGGFGSNNNQSNAGQGFGQPARIGSGQQALGSVLGSFGQSRQFGAGLPGSVASPSPFGSGFGGNQSAGGFATASSGGGFANLASGGGGFGGLATGAGGFAAVATGGGGFAAAATGAGGFAAATASGGGFGAATAAAGGFAAAASGGFGGFSSQGGSGFSTFGSTGGTARHPSELFTQMRK